eukprot:scaffold12676_cov112-Isochrysis_galbana.AAC.7
MPRANSTRSCRHARRLSRESRLADASSAAAQRSPSSAASSSAAAAVGSSPLRPEASGGAPHAPAAPPVVVSTAAAAVPSDSGARRPPTAGPAAALASAIRPREAVSPRAKSEDRRCRSVASRTAPTGWERQGSSSTDAAPRVAGEAHAPTIDRIRPGSSK